MGWYNKKMKHQILIATDHAGFELKQALIPYIQDMGFDVKDFGAHEFLEDDDYPDYIAPLAKEISENGGIQQAIVIGGSGQGEAMVANRFRHVRAVVFNGQYHPASGQTVPLEVKTAREHNDANVLSLGARFLTVSDAKEAVKTFLTTPFSEEKRHIRRLRKLDELSK